MTLEKIIQQTRVMTNNIVDCAVTACSNQFSSKIYYIKVSAKDLSCSKNFYERQKKMINFFTKGKLLREKEIALEINNQQDSLSWIDFELYYASFITVIMTIFVPKEQNNENLQFHSCFEIPPWADKSFDPKYLPYFSFKAIVWKLKYKDYQKKGKFDINWKFISWSARWKIFCWKYKIRFR